MKRKGGVSRSLPVLGLVKVFRHQLLVHDFLYRRFTAPAS